MSWEMVQGKPRPPREVWWLYLFLVPPPGNFRLCHSGERVVEESGLVKMGGRLGTWSANEIHWWLLMKEDAGFLSFYLPIKKPKTHKTIYEVPHRGGNNKSPLIIKNSGTPGVFESLGSSFSAPLYVVYSGYRTSCPPRSERAPSASRDFRI